MIPRNHYMDCTNHYLTCKNQTFVLNKNTAFTVLMYIYVEKYINEMDNETIEKLKCWADVYNTAEFIPADPVSFPHRFSEKKDIEISGFLTAWIAYGNRKQILKRANEVHDDMEGKPYEFITKQGYNIYKEKEGSFYRFFKYSDLYEICHRLNAVYTNYKDMEQAVNATDHDAITALQKLFDGINGIPYTTQSACKRLAMFLRWMIRRDKIVDFGIWQSMDPTDLLIPLDTHVFKMAKRLGMTKRSQADRKAAEEITSALRTIWNDDPCKGDFALFGYGVNEKI